MHNRNVGRPRVSKQHPNRSSQHSRKPSHHTRVLPPSRPLQATFRHNLSRSHFKPFSTTTTPPLSSSSPETSHVAPSPSSPSSTTSSTPVDSQIPDDDDIEPQAPPSKSRYPIPPVPMQYLPRVGNFASAFAHPIKSLLPEHYPSYAMFMDFQEKSSLLGWRIITDSELNGTSEASLAWGTAKCPVTGEPIRTLVFQGRLGKLILPEEVYQNNRLRDSNGKDSTKSRDSGSGSGLFSRMKQQMEKKHHDHAELLSNVAQDPDVDYGDDVSQSIGPKDDATMQDNTRFGALHGFVGLMSPTFEPPLDISRWDTFNICVRTDGGPWMSSMKPDTSVGTELFMAGLPAPDGNIYYPRKTAGFMRKPMRNLFVPIKNMTVMESGRTRTHSEPSSVWPCQGFGFSIRGPPGPFKIEVAWIALANSQDAHLDTPSVPTPSPSIDVDLPTETIKHTAQLNDQELLTFAQSHRSQFESIIQDRSIEAQRATGNTAIDTRHVISIDDIQHGRPTIDIIKRNAAQLGANVREIDEEHLRENIRQNRAEYQDEDDDDSISVANSILGRRLVGSRDGGVNAAPAFDFSNINSVDFESQLYHMQQRAKELTGSDRPLITPNYAPEMIMVKAREQAARLGFISQKHVDETYVNPPKDEDIMKQEMIAQAQARIAMWQQSYNDETDQHNNDNQKQQPQQQQQQPGVNNNDFDNSSNNNIKM